MLRTAGRPPGASEAGVSRAGQVVDSVGKKNRTRVTREFLSNGGPSDPSASCPGNLATPRHSAQARVTWGIWLTPWALGPKRESPGRASRPRRPSDQGPSCPGELVNPAGTGARPQVGRDIWSSPQALRHGPESPRRAGQYHGPSDTSASRAGVLVRTAGHRTRARVALDSWSPPRAIGPERVWPGTDGRHRGPMDKGPRRPGVRVDPRAIRAGRESSGERVELAGSRTRARVSQES